jgi:threonine dehydratase
MNFDRLRFVAERAEVGEEREALLAVTIPEERGSFRRFCELIGQLPGGPRNVTEFNYRITTPRRQGACVRRPDHGGQGRIAQDRRRPAARGFDAST